MKYISELTEPQRLERDRLFEEQEKKIAELKEENARLHEKIATLEGIEPPKPRSIIPQAPGGLNTRRSHYAQQTESSRRKTKTAAQDDNGKCSPIVVISGIKYMYTNGVPSRLPIRDKYPHYREETDASYYRDEAIAREFGLQLAENRGNSDVRERDGHQATQSVPANFWYNPGYTPAFKIPKWNRPRAPLARMTRLNDSLGLRFKGATYVDSEKTLEYLQQARKVVQKSIFDIGKSGVLGWRNSDFLVGPHAIRLGRDELMSWLDNWNWGPYSLDGVDGRTIYDDIIAVVPLRNAVCHACAGELAYGRIVDNLLKKAQTVTVTLNDEKGSLEIRRIRDLLLADVRASRAELLATFALRSQPFQEHIKYPHHHVMQLENAKYLTPSWKGSANDPEVLAASRDWEVTRDASESFKYYYRCPPPL